MSSINSPLPLRNICKNISVLKSEEVEGGPVYPGEEADTGWDSEGGGVVAQPGEIECYFDAEIFRDLISVEQTMLDIQWRTKYQ